MQAPITSRKHIVQHSLGSVTAGNVATADFILAVKPADANLPTEVVAGAVVKAVYIEYWVASDDATQSTFIFTIEKKSSTQTDITAAQMASLDGYGNKKNILFTSMGLTSQKIGTPTPVLRQWIKIPKGKQRFGLEDELVVNLMGQSDGVTFCGFALFKEYS